MKLLNLQQIYGNAVLVHNPDTRQDMYSGKEFSVDLEEWSVKETREPALVVAFTTANDGLFVEAQGAVSSAPVYGKVARLQYALRGDDGSLSVVSPDGSPVATAAAQRDIERSFEALTGLKPSLLASVARNRLGTGSGLVFAVTRLDRVATPPLPPPADHDDGRGGGGGGRSSTPVPPSHKCILAAVAASHALPLPDITLCFASAASPRGRFDTVRSALKAFLPPKQLGLFPDPLRPADAGLVGNVAMRISVQGVAVDTDDTLFSDISKVPGFELGPIFRKGELSIRVAFAEFPVAMRAIPTGGYVRYVSCHAMDCELRVSEHQKALLASVACFGTVLAKRYGFNAMLAFFGDAGGEAVALVGGAPPLGRKEYASLLDIQGKYKMALNGAVAFARLPDDLQLNSAKTELVHDGEKSAIDRDILRAMFSFVVARGRAAAALHGAASLAELASKPPAGAKAPKLEAASAAPKPGHAVAASKPPKRARKASRKRAEADSYETDDGGDSDESWRRVGVGGDTKRIAAELKALRDENEALKAAIAAKDEEIAGLKAKARAAGGG